MNVYYVVTEQSSVLERTYEVEANSPEEAAEKVLEDDWPIQEENFPVEKEKVVDVEERYKNGNA